MDLALRRSPRRNPISVNLVPQAKAPYSPKPLAASTSSASAVVPPHADPLRATLNSVYFSDAQHGWAGGTAGALLVTTDGGANWRVQPTGTDQDIATVIFANDGRRGWLVLANNHMRITGDGGQSWREQANFDDWPILSELLSATGRTELRLHGSDRGGVIRAAGTEVWALGPNTLHVVRASDANPATVAEWHGFAPTAMQISADGQRIVVAGAGGAIRSSADGGKTWTAVDTGKHGDVQGLYCDDGAAQCAAVGDSGSILLGSNLQANAENWRSLTAGAGATFIWARFNYKDAGIDEGEAVTGADRQLATHDGGMTWEVLGQNKLPAANARNSNMFVDGALQWRVGPLGKAERSDDGGKTWHQVATGSDKWFWSVFFMPDHQRGWIAGSDGESLPTRDAGASWQKQATPTRNWLWHISMASDGKHGRALGGYGIVLLSDDGGVHWNESAPSPAAAPRRGTGCSC